MAGAMAHESRARFVFLQKSPRGNGGRRTERHPESKWISDTAVSAFYQTEVKKLCRKNNSREKGLYFSKKGPYNICVHISGVAVVSEKIMKNFVDVLIIGQQV